MDRFFGLNKTNSPMEGLALLCTVANNIQQAIVESILNGAEIPFLIKERGSGSAVKIITGFSMFGTDFYVSEENFEEASELVSGIFDEHDEGEDENSDDGDEEKDLK